MIKENHVARAIVGAAYKIHLSLGSGLLESVYEAVLSRKLIENGFRVQRQVAIPIVFEDLYFDEGFRADLIVEDCVIVELKSIVQVDTVHSKQLLTYLRLSETRLALLITFFWRGAIQGRHQTNRQRPTRSITSKSRSVLLRAFAPLREIKC